MNATVVYPFIVVAGALQALGNSMNAQLRTRLVNPWLAATVSFLPVVFVFATLFLTMPAPLPAAASLAAMHWYAPMGGIAGALAVFTGLMFVDKLGAGPFNGLIITGNILFSLVMDSLGLFGLTSAGFQPQPWLGGLLMVVGVAFIAQSGAANSEESDDHRAGAKLLYPLILIAGAFQALGAVLNADLRSALTNAWLAATVSFVPVLFLMAFMFLVRPTPLPQRTDLESVRWWMPLAGITGALAVFAGLLVIDKVGAGTFNGILITASLLASIALDHFGWVGMRQVKIGPTRVTGAVLMVGGITLISML